MHLQIFIALSVAFFLFFFFFCRQYCREVSFCKMRSMYKTMQRIGEKKQPNNNPTSFLSHSGESETKESDRMKGDRERKGWDRAASNQWLSHKHYTHQCSATGHVSVGAVPVC